MVTIDKWSSSVYLVEMPLTPSSEAIFIVRQLQEKYIAANKSLYFAFVNLKKAFDNVHLRKFVYTMILVISMIGLGIIVASDS